MIKMPEQIEAKNNERKPESKLFLNWFAAACFLLLLSLAFVMRIPSQNVNSEVIQQQGLIRRSSFDLRNTDPLAYLGTGMYLVRQEEGSVIFMDALGKVQQAYEIPFREAEIFSSGGNLFIKSNLSSNLIMFRPQYESVVIETDSSVENIKASEERVLLLHKAENSLGELRLYDIDRSLNILTLSFYDSGYPLDMAFHEDGKGFDLCLLDVSQAQTSTVLQKYNEWGEKVAEMTLSEKEVLAAVYLLNDNCTAMFNNETVVLVDLSQEEILYEVSFEKIDDLALAENKMALLSDSGDKLELQILLKSESSFEFVNVDSFNKADGRILMVNSPRNIFLSQGNLIRAYDFGSGALVAESELSEPVKNLMAQDNNTLIVLTDQNGYLYSLD